MPYSDHARISFVVVSAIYSCACSGAAPEEGKEAPFPETSTASAQVEVKCAASHEQIIDLGSFTTEPPMNWSEGEALNEQGTVVGHSVLRTSAGVQRHAFRWKAETGMVDLGTLGGIESDAYDVNDRDEVVGFSYTAEGWSRGVLWDAENRIHDLGTLGGLESWTSSINNRGQVVGMATDATGNYHAFIWDAENGMVAVDLPGPYPPILRDINDSGVVVGTWSQTQFVSVPFKWTREDGPTVLDLLGHETGDAWAINNQAEIAGSTSGCGDNFGLKWTGSGAAVRLPQIPNGLDTTPRAINDVGAMVGDDSAKGPFIAAQWDAMLRVSVIPLDARYSTGRDINNCGDVTGARTTTITTDSHAYLWHPERAGQ